MRIFYRIVIITSLIITSSYLFVGVLCAKNDFAEVAAELNDDMYTIFIEEAPFCKKIIDKYSREKNTYLPLLINILKDQKSDPDTIHNAIYLLAILREDSAQTFVQEIADRKTGGLNGVDDFYFLRINKEKDSHLKKLKALFEKLLNKDTIDDNKIITYLPFLDNFNVSLYYLNKMSQKSDGAGSELLNWSLDYMNFVNASKRKIIENSIAYHKFYGTPEKAGGH